MPLYGQGRGTGFIGAGRYLRANRGTGERMAGALSAGLEKDAGAFGTDLAGLQSQFVRDQVKKDAPKTLGDMTGYADLAKRAADVSLRAKQAGRPGGAAQQLQGVYGRTTAGGSALDGFLAQAEGGTQLAGLGTKFGDLSKALGVADAESRGLVSTLGPKLNGSGAQPGGPGPKPGANVGAPAPTPGATGYTPNYNREGWRETDGGEHWRPDQDKEFAYYRDATFPDLFGIRIGGSGVMEMGEQDRAVYDDMSLEEREYLRKLPKNERKAWIDNRRGQIQGRARAAGF